LESSSEFEDVVVEPEQASRPLKTLKKLQAMLDETDYMTTSSHRATIEAVPEAPSAATTTATMIQPAKVDPPLVSVPSQQSIPIQPASQQQQQQQQQHNGYDMAAEDSLPPMSQSSSESETLLLPPPQLPELETDKLWTSKDRIKYKKQQERVRRVQEERRRLEQQLHQGGSSDDDADAESGTDDGLGYTLPNLSVYLSDAEETADDGIGYVEQPMRQQVNNAQLYPPPPPFAQQQLHQQQTSQYYQHQQYQGQYPPYPPPQPDQLVPQYLPYPPNQYMPYPPYGQYTPQQQQMIAAQYASWASQASSMPYRPYRPFQPQGVAIMPPPTIYSSKIQEELPPENGFAMVSTVPMEEYLQNASMDTVRQCVAFCVDVASSLH
jgi:hypothetical protein